MNDSKLEPILKYFPDLTDLQRERFAALYGLYADWNAKINVVSRKDFDQLYLRRQGLHVRRRGTDSGRGVRRRIPLRAAGDPLSRGAFHGRRLHPQEDNGG